jgi:Fe-S-cluster-containing hydrogenase component 2
MEKLNLAIKPELCTQCSCCQLQCSLVYTGSFNPEEARIMIAPPDSIIFSEECLKGCSLCARYCVYGAISLRKNS